MAEVNRKELPMRKDEIVMLNEKAAFVAQLESALLSDAERSGLDSICYEYDLTAQDEVITIIFEGAALRRYWPLQTVTAQTRRRL